MDGAQPGSSGGGALSGLEDFFDTYLHKKIPFHLPPSVKEFIVKFGPWITLVLMLLALPVILAALGLTAFLTPFAMVYGTNRFGGTFLIQGLVSLAALVMEAVALPGLFARSLKGWHLLFYAVLVNFIGSLIALNILGAIIGTVISLYVLFQIREYYK